MASIADGKLKALAEGTATIITKAGNETITVINLSTVDAGVVINGIKWATHNVTAPRHITDKMGWLGQ